LDGRHLWHSSEFDVWSLLVSPRYLLQERIFLKISPFRVALSKFGMITPTFWFIEKLVLGYSLLSGSGSVLVKGTSVSLTLPQQGMTDSRNISTNIFLYFLITKRRHTFVEW
jgi:hypothetical protein